ncbi:type II toxin-antitoxin system HigB family toxin [Spirosoma sp. RP8]|uniref:Type II toxin-antitoxin system HigB family toxin n=1 Tax=Spirosoma liriopis TaxID=2937440 RepID=A0ABT0HLS0_9BACT|nr:type II toxin-antitoxin system HigB family toxin [Spirosoma liriopis]MCK8493126.1 type II toxin-antitoxin system HigB family toxin [Spirosoma liriopis]
MRVIARKTIVSFYTVHSTSKSSLEAFYHEVLAADWDKPSDVIAAYPSADVITGKRFVFNIKGNNYRLVADIEFKLKLVFIVWIGTHAEYDKIDVKTVKYVKSD